jgi:hypothetical protein
LNAAGQAAGFSNRFYSDGTNLGTDSWFFNGTSTQRIGLTGSEYEDVYFPGEDYEGSSPFFLNNTGEVTGISSLYAPNGQPIGNDTWFFAKGSTERIGLTGGVYSYTVDGGTDEFSVPSQLNDAGDVAGISNRQISPGLSLGGDCWFFNGKTTKQIGLTGSGYSYNNGNGIYETSAISQMNAAGDVIGTSLRFSSTGTSLGQDGWFYDPAQNKTYALEFSIDSSDDNCITTPGLVMSNGDVLGSYELYGGSADEGARAFEWSESSGFVDLGSVVIGGLSAHGWNDLANALLGAGTATDGSPMYIAGSGDFVNESDQGAAFLLATTVPEPASLTVLIGSIALCAVRRLRKS